MNTRPLRLPSTLLLLLSLSACASAERAPADLAAQLKGRAVKMRAFRDGNRASELGFVALKFRDCADTGPHLVCRVDLESEPVQARGTAVVQGNRRSFTVSMKLAEANRYHLDTQLTLAWQGARWSGKGKVDGWLHPDTARAPASQVAVRESLDF